MVKSDPFMAKKKMSKKKIILIVLIVFVVLILVVGFLWGNKFYDIAIARNDKNDIFGELDTSAMSENKELNDAIATRNRRSDSFVEANKSESAYITSLDGLKLQALKYTVASENTAPVWVISVHGFASYSADMNFYASYFTEMGYNVLLPDLRGHGKSEGKYVGMGWDDREDIMMWANSLVQDNPECQIILHGVSMGAASVLNASGEHLLSDRVKAVIADSSFTSAENIFKYQLKNMFSLPAFPTLPLASVVTQIRAGYNLYDVSPIKQLETNNTPLLFIHGGKDDFIPIEMMEELYLAAGDVKKDKLIIENGYHAHCSTINPTTYFDKVQAFIKQNISE